MKKSFMARQGDVVIRQVEVLPLHLKKSNTNIVAVGKGHHDHGLYGDIEVMEDEQEKYFLSVNSEGVLEHNNTGTRKKAEHEPITIPKGLYEVVHQRQYNPYEKAIERVRD